MRASLNTSIRLPCQVRVLRISVVCITSPTTRKYQRAAKQNFDWELVGGSFKLEFQKGSQQSSIVFGPIMLDDYLVPLETHCVYYDEDFINHSEASGFYQTLLNETKWEKTAKINRWVCLYQQQPNQSPSDENDEELVGKAYKYRDAPSEVDQSGFPVLVHEIQQRAQAWYQNQTGEQVEFNVCLLNFYENGQQRIGWHSDREEVGRDTPIISISIGAKRSFMIRSKTNGVHDRATIPLTTGSLLVMENICQMEYLHSIPREPDVSEGRINLTFRCKKDGIHTAGEEEHERRDTWLEDIVDGAAPSQQGWTVSHEMGDGESIMFGSNVPSVVVKEPIRYLVKTNIGAEHYVAAELQELLPDGWSGVARPLELDGYTAVCSELDMSPQLDGILLQLKSAQHIIRYHVDYSIDECCTPDFPSNKEVDGERLYQHFKRLLVEEKVKIDSVESAATFRVTSERIGGPHAFQAPEVEREIGGAISEYYSDCKPRMQDYDVNIRADVIGYRIVIGTQVNVQDLSKERHFLKFRNAVTIKTNLAYAMVRCANIMTGAAAHVADPFCGSGTILLEALEVHGKNIYCTGLDVSRRSVDGARENAKAEGYAPCSTFVCSDARGLRKHLEDDTLDAIVTNLPWGVRTGSKNVNDLQTMYEVFLRTAWYVLKPGARVVMFVLRGLQLIRIVRKLGGRYKILSINVIRTANNLPCIVVIEKLGQDVLRESVKGQLAHLNQYMSVSPEMYEAIHMEDINS